MRAPLGRVDFGFDGETGKPLVMRGDHMHHEIEINFLFEGWITYLTHGEVVTIPSGRLSLFWAAVPHRVLETAPDARFCWITIPLAWFLAWPLPRPFVRGLLGGKVIQAQPDPADRALCLRWQRDIHATGSELRQIALLEIEARIRRIAREPHARTKPGASRKGTPTATLGHVEKMARYIVEHHTEEIYMEDIAKAAGLHVNYASTLFSETCGMSPQRYLTQHRIFHAQRLLATTDRKVIDVALESGFRSASQFYETFAGFCGEPPRKYRMRFQQAGS